MHPNKPFSPLLLLPIALLLLLFAGSTTYGKAQALLALPKAGDYTAIGTLTFHYKTAGGHVVNIARSGGKFQPPKYRIDDESYFQAEKDGKTYTWTTIDKAGTANYYLRTNTTFARQVFALASGDYITLKPSETLEAYLAAEKSTHLWGLCVPAGVTAITIGYCIWWVVETLRRKRQGKPTYGKLVKHNIQNYSPSEKQLLGNSAVAMGALMVPIGVIALLFKVPFLLWRLPLGDTPALQLLQVYWVAHWLFIILGGGVILAGIGFCLWRIVGLWKGIGMLDLQQLYLRKVCTMLFLGAMVLPALLLGITLSDGVREDLHDYSVAMDSVEQGELKVKQAIHTKADNFTMPGLFGTAGDGHYVALRFTSVEAEANPHFTVLVPIALVNPQDGKPWAESFVEGQRYTLSFAQEIPVLCTGNPCAGGGGVRQELNNIT